MKCPSVRAVVVGGKATVACPASPLKNYEDKKYTALLKNLDYYVKRMYLLLQYFRMYHGYIDYLRESI